jgi:hypothetical protein
MLSIESHSHDDHELTTAHFRLGRSAAVIDSLSMTKEQWRELKHLLESSANSHGVAIDIRERERASGDVWRTA